MKDLMLDLEAIGQAITQIGAIYFDRKTGVYGDCFSVNIRIDSCIAEGLLPDQHGITWWLEQAKAGNSCHFLKAPIDLRSALEKLRSFARDADCVWSHGYDSRAILNACEKCGIGPVIHYRRWRDIRTLLDLAGPWVDAGRNEKSHDALGDCLYQVKYCVLAMQRVEAKSAPSCACEKELT